MAVQLVIICTFGCERNGCEHVHQEYSLPEAEARNARWTSAELAFIEGTQEEPLGDVANALGRTYYGTAQARSKVKRGILRA
jgi:hypothetical protein